MASVPGGATASLKEQVLRRKPVGVMAEETGADADAGELKRSIGLFQLTLFGVGATIGTGIFIVLTQAVPIGGPAVILSFVFAGTVAGLTAICYAELASAVPVSGSSYSYAYATLGEGVAMVVAACLLLEYGVSAAAVAVGWSQYLNELLDNLFGFTIPESLSQAPEQGGVLNIPAVILIALCASAPAPRGERVGARQRDHGDDQDRRAGPVHRARAARAGTPTTSRTSPRPASTGSPRRRASSSSPTSASMPSRRPARRSRTRGGTCRWRSCSRS